MDTFMKTRLIGIVDNTLYIEGLYGGDHLHSSIISDWTKSDLIDRGVREFSCHKELDDHHSDILWKEMFDDNVKELT
jgi:hypothetical protein